MSLIASLYHLYLQLSKEYILGVPQIPNITKNLKSGKKFMVIAENLSKENKYEKEVYLNNEPINGFKINHDEYNVGRRVEIHNDKST